MTLDGYLKRLAAAGISREDVPHKTDGELLRVKGFSKRGLAMVRERLGPSPEPPTFEQRVHNALAPVLMRYRGGCGPHTVRKLARMVAAYFD